MKLIDILVAELPKRGGWPDGIEEIWQDYDGLIRPGAFGWYHDRISEDHRKKHEDAHVKINRKQYEAALAAIEQGWNGEGMPPIGSKVSFFYNERYDYHKEIIPEHGQELEVVAHKTTTDGHDVAVCYWDKSGGGMAVCLVPGSLLPIRSEADKKREDLAKALHIAASAAPIEIYGIGPLYLELADKIIAGEVAGIRIE